MAPLACRIDPKTRAAMVNPGFPLMAYRLATMAGLPFRFMGFEDGNLPAGFLVKNSPTEPVRRLNSSEWKNELDTLGIGAPGHAGKAINRASSSGYHGWQREHLGNITAVDIDLVRLDNQGAPSQVIELKRSSIPMDKWAPFAEDAKNFHLMGRFCQMAGVDFLLAFNEYNRSTLADDLSRIKVFEYAPSGFADLGKQSWEEWEQHDRPAPQAVKPPQMRPGR